MRSFSTLILAAGTLPTLGMAQEAPVSPRWAVIHATVGDRIDVDTSSIETKNGVRVVWLRWHFASSDIHTLLQVERRAIDCIQASTRQLVSQYVEIDAIGRRTVRPEAVNPSEAAWHPPASGSLIGEVIAAVCRLPRAGAESSLGAPRSAAGNGPVPADQVAMALFTRRTLCAP